MAVLEGYIKNAHPGTEVLNVDAYNDLVSAKHCIMSLKFMLSVYTHDTVDKWHRAVGAGEWGT